MDNQITLSGYIGSAINYRSGENESGKWSRVEFRLGSTRRVRKGDSWADGTTLWVTVQAWRNLADNARDSLRLGEPVVVSGRLHVEEWADDKGEIRQTMMVTADTIGHDLTRGRTRFGKVVALPEPAPVEENVVELSEAEVRDLVDA